MALVNVEITDGMTIGSSRSGMSQVKVGDLTVTLNTKFGDPLMKLYSYDDEKVSDFNGHNYVNARAQYAVSARVFHTFAGM